MGILKLTRIALLAALMVTIITGCKPEDDGPENYTITYKVDGSSITQIYFRSHQQDFDVTNVPTHHWGSTNVLLGADTITLYGRQAVTDSLNPIIVTLMVGHNGAPTLTYSDTNATATSVSAVLAY